MKNLKLTSFQNGVSIILANSIVKAGKANESASSPYMYKGKDGLWYPDKEIISIDIRGENTGGYSKASNYFVYRNGKNITLFYYSIRTRGNYSGSSMYWSQFSNAVSFDFNSVDQAIKLINTGDISKALASDYHFSVPEYQINESNWNVWNKMILNSSGEVYETKKEEEDGFVFYSTEVLGFQNSIYITTTIDYNPYKKQ